MTGRSRTTGLEPEPNPPADAVESVPGYRDLARIGHGGFGVVYRAVQESFERAVALKVLTIGPDEDARRRFLREVRLASRLSGHPHVVTVLDTGTTASGRPYLAMDLYDGGSMKERLNRSGPLSPAETAMVGAKIAEALAAAHSLGVLHRDVTPNNILVSRFGEPALADFGVSCLLDSSSSASVLDVFSPQHAAPELMTKGVPTASSDVYSLGSTLYQLLTGQPPFGGEGRDVRSIMWRVMSEPPPRPACPGIPLLADAIMRAMAKEPEQRFPDAAGFAQALRALIPEGTPSTLPMSGLAQVPAADRGAAAGADTGSGRAAQTGSGADRSSGPDCADQTMVRPDRADPLRAGEGADGAADTEGGRLRRARVPLTVAVTVGLLAAAAWAVFASQDTPKDPQGAAAPQHSAATPAAFARTAGPTPRATPTRTATAAPTESAKPTHSATAAPRATKPAAPGSALSLPGSPDRYQNAQSGDCLSEPSGSSAAAQASCAGSGTEGWAYSLSLGGILNVPAGQFELVNEQSGQCLTAGSGGQVDTQACDSGSAQLWSTVGGLGAGKEFQNAGDGQCLRAAQSGAVADGPCSTSDQVDLWNEDGTA
jgi:serine/threonine-protein kinase PknK